MNRWIPVPWAAVRAADRTRYDTDTPAPEIVGWALMWAAAVERAPRTSRVWAADLGWTRHRVREMMKRVQIAQRNFNNLAGSAAHFPPKPAQNRPPAPSNYNHLDGAHNQSPPKTDRSRARDLNLNNKLIVFNCGDQISDVWGSLKPDPGALSEGYRDLILSLLNDGRSKEELIRVWVWAHTSPHKRAEYLRVNGYTSPRTIFNPVKFDGYLRMATATARTATTTTTTTTAADPMAAFLKS